MASKLWDDVRKSLQDLGNIAAEKGKIFSKAAADKAEELTRSGKLKLDILQVNREIDHLFSQLGGKVYHLESESALDTIPEDDEIQKIFEKIKKLEARKKDLEEKVESIPEEKAEAEKATTAAEEPKEPTEEEK
ncbi:MAG TPA: hypothetical protein VKA68_14830 [bacterium]|nr:hypothetical protein [bacterium]